MTGRIIGRTNDFAIFLSVVFLISSPSAMRQYAYSNRAWCSLSWCESLLSSLSYHAILRELSFAILTQLLSLSQVS